MLKIELLDEIKTFKTLSAIEKKYPFEIPESYFENSLRTIEIQNELLSYEKLVSVKKQNNFSTPDAYFETGALVFKNKTELLDELNSYRILNSLSKQHVFELPESYFENLNHSILEKTSGKFATGAGRVIHFVFNKRTLYAIAASLVLSLGTYYFTSKSDELKINDCTTLACIDRSEILHEVHLSPIDDEALMEMVNADKLRQNIEHNLQNSNREKDNDIDIKENYILENTDINDIADEI